VLGSIARGHRPGEGTKVVAGKITLRQAWERYRDAHMKRKERSTGTIESYRDHMERFFADWLDKPLARLGRQPSLVVERHDKITNANDPYIANCAMRSLKERISAIVVGNSTALSPGASAKKGAFDNSEREEAA
jgi:hypothetical protein